MDQHTPPAPGPPAAPATSAAVPSPYDRRGSSRGGAASPLELQPPEFPEPPRGGWLALLERLVKLWPLWAALAGAIVVLNAWSGLPARVARLEARADTTDRTLDMHTYLLCVQVRRSDPSMVPPGCTEPIEKYAPRRQP